jgi:hypothetical protein
MIILYATLTTCNLDVEIFLWTLCYDHHHQVFSSVVLHLTMTSVATISDFVAEVEL